MIMSNTLFSVRMERIIDIHTGTTVRRERVPEVYHNLPHSTARMYETKFPDANVVVLPTAEAKWAWGVVSTGEAGGVPDSSKFYTPRNDAQNRSSRSDGNFALKSRSTGKSATKSAGQTKVGGGDYADAITAATKEARRAS
jgi:hypothetical protein